MVSVSTATKGTGGEAYPSNLTNFAEKRHFGSNERETVSGEEKRGCVEVIGSFR